MVPCMAPGYKLRAAIIAARHHVRRTKRKSVPVPPIQSKNLPIAAATLGVLGPPPSSGPSRKAANLSDARSRGAKPEQDEDAEICTRGGT